MTLQKQILERIKTQGVKPTSKGYFKMRNYILWGLLGLIVSAMSVGFGMIIFAVKGADQSLFEKLGFSTSEKIINSIPFFWILATIAILGIAYINFRNTRRGYRINPRQFGLIALLIAIALGSIVYALNITKFVDQVASKRFPLYNAVVPLNTNVWLDPEHGLLSGTVKEKNSDEDFTLRDANSVLWYVTGDDISMPSEFEFHVGDRIKLIGSAKEGDKFRAIEIRPWE